MSVKLDVNFANLRLQGFLKAMQEAGGCLCGIEDLFFTEEPKFGAYGEITDPGFKKNRRQSVHVLTI